MHHFHLISLESAELPLLAPFGDSGFTIHPLTDPLEARPDVFLWRPELPNEVLALDIIQDRLPKVLVAIGNWNYPQPLHIAYDCQQFSSPIFPFSVATTLEGDFLQPDWAAYSALAPLTDTACFKAIANSVYSFLLEDVFRETAEWCGHMSSALRPW